jgi:hypothetical protein
MAVTKIRRISSIVFLITVAISLVVMGFFAFGGEVPEYQKLLPELSQPVHLELLMFWMYILVAITILVLLGFTIFAFIKGLKDNPKRAIGGLLALVALVVLLVITHAMGSGDILHIPGYTGDHNVPFWLRISDMWIFAIYVMVAINILAIIFAPLILKKRK